MPLEHNWALNGTALPPGIPIPPDWVKMAVNVSVITKFKRLNALRPVDDKATYHRQLIPRFGPVVLDGQNDDPF